ncbi:Peroxisomal catalase [Cytospora mali]|uniref:Peroxisomal catalase n=1 Tax=Cytospora mali TaxID=578113 RepID=A0A194UNC6_CYTMA|nr:Peroxisomal catalase [Valsa mali var. pyri (nom. inval.)]
MEAAPYANPSTQQHFSDDSTVKEQMLLRDTLLIENLAHFKRKMMPDRVVHAHFHAANPWRLQASANFPGLNGVGKDCKVLVKNLHPLEKGIHGLIHTFFDQGTPKPVRHVNEYSGHTYKLAKEDFSFVQSKMHFISDQHIEVLTNDEIDKLADEFPENLATIPHGAIEAGNSPPWKLYLQAMSPEDAEHYRWNIFDMIKVFASRRYSLITVSKTTLNRNVNCAYPG